MWEELFIRKTTQGGKTMKKGKKYVEAASKVEKNKLYTKLYQRVHRPSSPKNKYENKMKNYWKQGKPRQIC